MRSRELRPIPTTLWPEKAPDDVRAYMKRFFVLLDARTPETARQWAELFTEDGEFNCFGKVFNGRDELKAYLTDFWTSCPGLVHTAKKFWFHDRAGRDLFVVSNYNIIFPDGTQVTGDTAASLQLVDVDGKLLCKRNELFVDPGPLSRAIEAQKTSNADKSVGGVV
ncbi:hypothetical protein K469DRAFT_646451 [Zopfia rhizophila CBS 207.26]|uniref:SnoaL-like domain-containing protein n=1 Tax=Zopfia rhizophila CBS 207.26 TaxID=1314779 RepID=A0A6A6D9V1_9PEZI|nr:hypothetical protein K469DRAFT_646451 [Zopfia rhizophila CBS 207.26]